MKKTKLKLIESYIYAKTLYMLTKKMNENEDYFSNQNLVNDLITKSKMLLNICEQKIIHLKLNNISFLILKKELESCKIVNNNEIVLKKIREMLKNYSNHFNFVTQLK